MTFDQRTSIDAEADMIETTLRRWFGPTVGVAIRPIVPDPILHPAEAAFVAGAVPSRRAEFAAGRAAARSALAEIDAPPGAILVGSLRQPMWPPGTLGAISHDGRLACAVAARCGWMNGLGLDLAVAARDLTPSAEALILHPAEVPGVIPALLRFSIKESVVKAVSERVGHFLDPRTINVECGAGTFFARVRGNQLSGWWQRDQMYILTAAILPF